MPFNTSPAGRVYAHVVTPVHPKDWMYSASFPLLKTASLPHALNLGQWMPPVKDQGNLGACTAFAGTTLREFLSKKFVGTFTPLSPLFLYYVERTLENDIPYDSGSTIRSTMMALHHVGVCPETDDQYDVAKFAVQPALQDYHDAAKYVTGSYHRLMNLKDMKNCLHDGFVFNLGMNVYESFESDAMAANGVMTMPKGSEQFLGSHAVCCFGYDDNFEFPDTGWKGALVIRNSWSETWGDKGNFYMPYAYISHYVTDCWTTRLGTSWN